MKKDLKSPAMKIAAVGIMAASIECAKLALSFLPNIEAVSLLIALFSYSYGGAGIAAALIFVAIEPIIWGFGTWLPSYIIYWPALAALFMLFGKLKVKNRVLITATAVGMTFIFGILTAFFDVVLLSGSFERFFARFGIYYARGAVFYIVHIVSNAVIFSLLFPLLSKRLEKIKNKI